MSKSEGTPLPSASVAKLGRHAPPTSQAPDPTRDGASIYTEATRQARVAEGRKAWEANRVTEAAQAARENAVRTAQREAFRGAYSDRLAERQGDNIDDDSILDEIRAERRDPATRAEALEVARRQALRMFEIRSANRAVDAEIDDDARAHFEELQSRFDVPVADEEPDAPVDDADDPRSDAKRRFLARGA